MNVREWVNNNSAVVTIVAVLVLCFALAFIIWNNTRSNIPGPIDVYFVDLNTNEIFIAKSDQLPPIAAPSDSGGQFSGVRVHIYACGECPSGLGGRLVTDLNDDVHVAYYERYTDDAKAAMRGEFDATNPDEEMYYYEVMESGHEVRGADSTQWVSMNTEAGYDTMENVGANCDGGGTVQLCRP